MKKPSFEIVAGRKAPCELIKNKLGGGYVVVEGTYTYCKGVLDAINEGKDNGRT